MRRFSVMIIGLLVLAALPAVAQTESAEESGIPLTGGAAGLPAPATTDTVRTNLWLVEALMAEIAADAASALPEPPASVAVESTRENPANEMFRVVAGRLLAQQGYEVFVSSATDSTGRRAQFRLGYDVVSVDLRYPEVGRTLGLWRRWVSRNLQVITNIEVTRNDSGQLLLADRMTRSFNDRLEDAFFDDVNSETYDFTSAETSESGWKRRTEEIIVLGTLAALIAVYFSNTSN